MLSEKFTTCSQCGKRPPEVTSFSIGDLVLCCFCKPTLQESPSETMEETVHNACRAAYKKGLIDAAQAVCRYCSRSKPTVLPGVISHGGVLCNAVGIIEILEMSGGWQADWPNVDHDSDKR
jgi:hypothetical protein